MMASSFFDDPRDQSKVKSRIVNKYFGAWAKVIIPWVRNRGRRLAYIDLFCGPGLYKDGTESTPLQVLKTAIDDPEMRDMLVSLFNDKNRENTEALRETISALPGIESLKYKPDIENEEVGSAIVEFFRGMRLIPSLLFIDPWGYKGLSLSLIGSVLKDWGCDCIFFFNYNRINMGLDNAAVRDLMDDLFGESRANRIRTELVGLSPSERESLIIEELSRALKEQGAAYVLPFCFKDERGTRTKQHLIFASKNFTAYDIMKGIMARESSEEEQGVASFEFSPASKKYPLLFALSRPLDELEESLLIDFGGRRLSFADLYQEHSVGKPYVKSNYKKALSNLEIAGKIGASPPSQKRRKIKGETTFADSVIVLFPKRGRE